MVWDFTTEQDPDKVIEYLKGKCCGYSREAQLTALCWALANIYQALLNIAQHPQEKEIVTRPTDTVATPTPAAGIVATPTPAAGVVATPTPVTGTATDPENQPVPVSVAPSRRRNIPRNQFAQ
ncbi:ubiquitin carboxyl-terminal hydrolase 4 [Limosa lapponica baueri]|uniref:Ubiquitin carboxyl-terminal hydrolase 4 n=1 Tax=Limosa lapponica baueri TaxID=1758121 RepID=A0A2I0T8S2_LIMLA|nr:ubiquitin carboxyl-terminal hydrolase 4 [Limosa lapponica baueri]